MEQADLGDPMTEDPCIEGQDPGVDVRSGDFTHVYSIS